MYPPMEMDNGTYYMKPMNCPMHCLIFRSRQRSYRELPLRLFELGTVYRYERAGTLHGLMRIRGFTQDDSHIYCTPEQAADEIASLLDFVLSVLRAFGFDDFTFNLSTKDPHKYVGTRRGLGGRPRPRCAPPSSATASSTRSRRATPRSTGRRSTSTSATPSAAPGSCRRSSTTSTTPSASSLEYVGADNARHRPIMLHRALFGSVERFFGVLLEHYAGNLPTWLAPVQVRVLPVATAHEEYAEKVADRRAGGRRPRRRRSAPASSSASGSAPPSWRSCRTSSSSATTTSPPARSASTAGQRQARARRRPRRVRRALRRRGRSSARRAAALQA